MRQEYFKLTVTDIDWLETDDSTAKPTIIIDYSGPKSILGSVLEREMGDRPSGGDLDVSFRLQAAIEADDTPGVLAVTNRITGDFLFEATGSTTDMLTFVRAARRYGEIIGDADSRYTLEIRHDGSTMFAFEKQTFLLYDHDGTLMRKHCLIPSGVEL